MMLVRGAAREAVSTNQGLRRRLLRFSGWCEPTGERGEVLSSLCVDSRLGLGNGQVFVV